MPPTLPEPGRQLRSGALSAEELTRATLDDIGRRDGELHAFAEVFARTALAEARAADAALRAGRDLGPLHGMPVAVKDVFDIGGRAMGAGSRVPLPVASEDAACIALLRRAGAVLIGVTQTYEFCTVGPDPTLPLPPARNPRAPERITGGSSSGSAVAVAAGMVRMALGTDTGGSVRAPAAYCGVVGLKPTRGRISTRGLLPLAPSLDHVGPIAATVAEAARLLDALSEPGWRPASAALGAGVAGLRIGLARNWFADDPQADPAVVLALEAAATVFTALGAQVEEITLPDYRPFEQAGALILDAEALESHRRRLHRHHGAYGPMARRSLLRGLGLDARDLTVAREAAALLTRRLATEFTRVDLIVIPTTQTPAPEIAATRAGLSPWTPMRTLALNLTGHPAISIPCNPSGELPVGLQLVAASRAEDLLCRAAHAFEASVRPSRPA